MSTAAFLPFFFAYQSEIFFFQDAHTRPLKKSKTVKNYAKVSIQNYKPQKLS